MGCHLPLQELPLVCPSPSSRSSARPYGKASSGPWDNSSLAVVMATLRRDGPSHRCFLHALESHREFFLSPNPLEQIPSRSQRRLRSQVGFSRFWLIFDARPCPRCTSRGRWDGALVPLPFGMRWETSGIPPQKRRWARPVPRLAPQRAEPVVNLCSAPLFLLKIGAVEFGTNTWKCWFLWDEAEAASRIRRGCFPKGWGWKNVLVFPS